MLNPPKKVFTAAVKPGDRVVIIHSSLPHLKAPIENVKRSLLRTLSHLVEMGVTVVAPAFTFSFGNGVKFEITRSPSETGILADWMLELDGALRTPHPIFSYVAIGPLAGELALCRNSTTFGVDSSFAWFEAMDARYVMLGCDFVYCSQFHRYEEEAEVPYRYFKNITGIADFGGGPRQTAVNMYVRDLQINAENDWSRVVAALHSGGYVNTQLLWGGLVESAKCRDVASVCREILAKDPMGMVQDRPRVEKACRDSRERQRRAPLRVALLGSSNLHLLKERVFDTLASFISDQSIEVYTSPFGQLFNEITDSSSPLYRFDADFTLFCDRIEDLLGLPHLDFADDEVIWRSVERYVDAINIYRNRNGGWISVNEFLRVGRGLDAPLRLSKLVQQANLRLTELAQRLQRINLNDMAQLISEKEATSINDQRLWYIGRFPFSESFSLRMARHVAGLILAMNGRTVRLLVLDLDNTLWGGVLGEDGISGIAIGGDYPGNAYQAFQRGLLSLKKRGIVLAIASKNDENIALRVLNKHDQMILRSHDFAALRINWSSKSTSIREIADELSLGLGSIMFIDDNPVEREQVRRNLPDVRVLELPDDPAMYLSTLLETPWIQSFQLTDEDRIRTASYQNRAKLMRDKTKYQGSAEEFFTSLETHVYMQPLDASNFSRALQLLQKTNQFNATTRRYSEKELKALTTANSEVFVIGLRDRYSEFENIGLLIFRWDQPEINWGLIDTYLLSCRVLGRGIEVGIIHWALAYAKKQKKLGLFGEIIETARNTPVRDLYAQAGFKSEKVTGLWRFDLKLQSPAPARWITFHSSMTNLDNTNEI